MINYAMLLGRVGKKDNRTLKNGSEMTSLSIATSRKYKDSSGNSQEQTTWHNISCFSKLAEVANKYVHVGDMIFVQGEIQHKKIEQGERAGQYAYSVHANEIKFVPGGKKSDGQSKPSQEKPATKQMDFEDDECPF
ncbi:Ssb Single-stranded DNA-binding protein [uncultured Caudovirales phage]|uniref:Single-stranded DNA-binding protein n=1 Tax=uncultured Caudovirales phage TaxID=2100421 RepID=A0A6J5LEL4_9CAUD|nr:Ssb Single-stranded DNA-binding protein [uncultured Caudovirales phage]CAB4132485.1 Ssb Single-stranded DNA-binding protein [uncultured Caudovirales phage]CAB4202552.1 Ssb Single-stranded DNA-binding protein [uncultured Caudovirales phage]CAB5207290.1 Ssb Single-stranded DNA-binding protein [uncultured Caudovirales phage]